ncbi:MAG: class I SAM-dependent methyltransferase [Bryobacteraceae bacterium]|nr:class I SAM-dependent methyltransferase [Bryobacteraceae bacterium]
MRREQGASAALGYCVDMVRAIAHERSVGNRIAGAQATAEFDRQYGVETTGLISMTSMTIDSPNYLYATVYKASDPDRFQEMMTRLPIRHQDYTFVDLGSGKGLTLLLASTFPFACIRGVEFAQELHQVAQANIRSYRNPAQKCRDVESVRADATQYEFPEDPLVIYLYHPFEEEVMAKVVDRIELSYRRKPRPILIAYLQPALRRLLDVRTFLRPVFEREIDEFDGKTVAGYALFSTREAAEIEVLRG